MHIHFPNCLSFIYIYMSMERTTSSTVYTQLSDSKTMSKCMLYMSTYNIYQHLCHMVFFIFPKNRLYYSNLFWLPISQKIPRDWTAIYHLSRFYLLYTQLVQWNRIQSVFVSTYHKCASDLRPVENTGLKGEEITVEMDHMFVCVIKLWTL